jgi:hypothetical protein
MYIYIHTFIYTYIHIHIYTYIYIHIYISHVRNIQNDEGGTSLRFFLENFCYEVFAKQKKKKRSRLTTVVHDKVLKVANHEHFNLYFKESESLFRPKSVIKY